MRASEKIAVAGATGRLGHHVVAVLKERGCGIVPISRSLGVDVITGDGLAEALSGVERVIDAATGPSPESQAAAAFFTTAAGNIQQMGGRAGVREVIAVSIIGTDRFTAGCGAAKSAHEQVTLSGPIPARILRAAQFHEFAGQLIDWGTRAEVSYVPNMRTQPVAARAVAEVLADLATGPALQDPPGPGLPGPGRSGCRTMETPDSWRSRARARKASSRWRRCSPRAAATRPGSRG